MSWSGRFPLFDIANVVLYFEILNLLEKNFRNNVFLVFFLINMPSMLYKFSFFSHLCILN